MGGVQGFCNWWAILLRNGNQHLFAFLCLALSLFCLCIQARGRIHGHNNWRQPHPCKDILGQSISYCKFVFVFFLFFVFVFKFQLEKLYMGWVIGGKSNCAYLCIYLCLCRCSFAFVFVFHLEKLYTGRVIGGNPSPSVGKGNLGQSAISAFFQSTLYQCQPTSRKQTEDLRPQ